MNTLEMLNSYIDSQKDGSRRLPKVVCADGFTMSVQASAFHYCTPRTDVGPYEEVEIGFPSAREDLLMEYAESPEDPTGTVYGWVPVEVAAAVIEKHGGFESFNVV